jgi:hypothetical protein
MNLLVARFQTEPRGVVGIESVVFDVSALELGPVGVSVARVVEVGHGGHRRGSGG